jgi:hypothetical protein
MGYIQEEPRGEFKPKMYGLETGEVITVVKYFRVRGHGIKSTTEKYTVVCEKKLFITVNSGNYPGSIDKFDIHCSNITIIRESGEVIGRIITKQPLKSEVLELVEGCLTQAAAADIVARRYGMGVSGAKSLLRKFGMVGTKGGVPC